MSNINVGILGHKNDYLDERLPHILSADFCPLTNLFITFWLLLAKFITGRLLIGRKNRPLSDWHSSSNAILADLPSSRQELKYCSTTFVADLPVAMLTRIQMKQHLQKKDYVSFNDVFK